MIRTRYIMTIIVFYNFWATGWGLRSPCTSAYVCNESQWDVPQGCWLQCFPSYFYFIYLLFNLYLQTDNYRQTLSMTDNVVWMSFGWWTILDTHGKLLRLKHPAALQFLTHSNQCCWHLLPYLVQRNLNVWSSSFTIWMAHIHNPSLNCLKA